MDKDSHWEKAKKTTFTLFNVLMDKDLIDLVKVLEKHPEYIVLVCEHFRYSYNYSETKADTKSASRLLDISEEYATNQFIRNILNKLEDIDELSLNELKSFIDSIQNYHPYIKAHYFYEITKYLNIKNPHPLQKSIILKKLKIIEPTEKYDFRSDDIDKDLTIPYLA
jgi:predicted transcriptional regulator